MRDFLNDFSADKIRVKYYLIKPLYSRKKRGLITLLTSLAVLAFLLAIVNLLIIKGLDNTWVILGITFFMIFVPTYIVGKLILKYDQNGKLYFYEDHLSIETKSGTQKLPYNEIIKIEYCGNLPKDLVSNVGFNRPYLSYKVRLYTRIKNSITIEATRDMFVFPEEKAFNSKIYPTIERTIRAIKPRYGISENSELRSKFGGDASF